MKILQYFSSIIVAGVAAAAIGVSVGGADASYAHDGEDRSNEQKATKVEAQTRTYSYTANSGDTYAQMVRKAVQTYGITTKKDIGTARIVAIETKASEQAGWPYLNEGQVVSFSDSLIKTWVDEAMNLPAADVAAWQTYVSSVNFDTRNIGE